MEPIPLIPEWSLPTDPVALHRLDRLFVVVHTGLIVFNAVGWYWRRTRRWHLFTLAGTAFSWFALGPLFGQPLGYCLCTDYHFHVRRGLEVARFQSYPQLLLTETTGLEMSLLWSNVLAGVIFAAMLVAAAVVNVGDYRRWRAARRGATGGTPRFGGGQSPPQAERANDSSCE